MMFVFYCLMMKTKTRPLYSLYRKDLHMQMRKAPDLWCAPLPRQTTKAFPWKNRIIRPGRIHSSATVNCPSSREIPWETIFQLLLSERLLARYCINRSSTNWSLAGGLHFYNISQGDFGFQGRHMCDCREGTGKIGDKIYEASPDCGKGEMRIARVAVGKLFIQILVSLEALWPTE